MIWLSTIICCLNMGLYINLIKVVDIDSEANISLMASMVFGDEKIYYTILADEKIYVCDLNGNKYPPIGVKGSGPNEFRSPEPLYFSSPFLFVNDVANQRLYRINVKTKRFEGTWRLQPSMDITILEDRIYSIPMGRLSKYGVSAMKLEMPVSDDVISDLPVIDKFLLKPMETRCQGMAYGALLIDSQNNFWCTITGDFRIEKYDSNGKLLKTIGKEPLEFQEPQVYLGNKYNRKALKKHYASFDKLNGLFEYRNMILLYRFKVLTDAWLDIYDMEGEPIGTVRMPPVGVAPFDVHNGKLYGWVDLEDDSENNLRIVEIQLLPNE